MNIEISKEEIELQLSNILELEVKIEVEEKENHFLLTVYVPREEDKAIIYRLSSNKDKGEEGLYKLFLLWSAVDGFQISNIGVIEMAKKKQIELNKPSIREYIEPIIIDEEPIE